MCDIDICKSGDQRLVNAHEIIGDACWSISICQTCASIIGVQEHGRLVDHVTNRIKLEQYWFKHNNNDIVDDPFI